MKKTRLIILICIAVLLSVTAFAKIHKTDIVTVDTIEYTLDEDDKLSCELFTDEDGIYQVKITMLETEGEFTPNISLKLSEGADTVFNYSTQQKYYENEEINLEKYCFSAGITKGEYKLEIQNLTKFSNVSFRIETTFTKEENIESFGNSSFETASVLENGKKTYGFVSMYDEEDFHFFEMPYDGYAFIQMYSPSVKYFHLYDENKNEIGSIDISIADETLIYELCTGLAKGKYFLSVTPEEDFSSPLYTLEVITKQDDLFEKEYNNTPEYATVLPWKNQVSGTLFGVDDEDVYSFTLSENYGVKIDFYDTVVSKKGHYSLIVTDGKNQLFSADDCGRKEVNLTLEKGTYYIHVEGLSEKEFTNMPYKLKVTPDKDLPVVEQENQMAPDDNLDISPDTEQFADVTEDMWYYDEILEAKSLGLINGVGDNLFKPEENVSVAEVLVMALNTYSKIIDYDFDLEPLEGEKWYDPYVLYTRNLWYNMGDFDSFERPATRAELAYIFGNHRLIRQEEIKKVNIPDIDENTKYYENIQKLYNVGILNGNDKNGTFYPDRNITRAEAAAIILRIIKAYPKNVIFA